jgi:multiple sugar transport system ATP-binding protein
MAGVALDRVTKRWGSFVGVEEFSLAIADREFLVLLGPSGCGKTTTMRMVAGLETPSSGTIRIGERVVNDLEPKDRDVAMVFQSYGLYPNMNVYENIRFPLKVRRVPKGEHRARVMRAAEMVELTSFLERKPKELSGGQRQRVALARAIVRQPQVFLMDEPLSNLDAKLRVSMRAQLKHLQHELAVTTIYVTHDQIEAMTLADRVVVMSRGKILQIGTPREIYDEPANLFVAGFIGSPAMNLVPGRLEDGTFVAEGMRVEGVGGGTRENVVLGIRAEDLALADPSVAPVKGPIFSVELLGDATQITLKIGKAMIAARGPKDFKGEIGAVVGFSSPGWRFYLFDGESEARLDRGQARAAPQAPSPMARVG